MKDNKTKYVIDENDMPKSWYNILPDLTKPLEMPINPQTLKPLAPKDLAPLFPMELIKQEFSQEQNIRIPEEVRDIYRLWRPSPLYRAIRLEKFLKTPAKIFFKHEGVSPSGSHKPNTSVAQAYYNMKEGTKRLTTETGAGQWGSSLAFASKMFGLKCKVYMVRCSYEQKPYRKIMMQTFGAECVSSPSNETSYGRSVLEKDPNCVGSLGIAISEAVEEAVLNDDTHYSLGSVLNHVLMHQTIIGFETQKQLEMAEEKPDIIIGCVGGGSNFAGLAFPFLRDKLKGKESARFIGVEPQSCPTLTKGVYAYDYGDTAGMTPLLKMHTLGHSFMPPASHAGGLRYHGMAPLISSLYHEKMLEAKAVNQQECFSAAVDFARTEGIIPAPESSHAIKAVIDEALLAKKENKAKTIVFNLSGHGHFDMSAYGEYFKGGLKNCEYSKSSADEALRLLPKI